MCVRCVFGRAASRRIPVPKRQALHSVRIGTGQGHAVGDSEKRRSRPQNLRRGARNVPGTNPALCGACPQLDPLRVPPSVRTPTVIPEEDRALGDSRRRASTNATRGPAGSSDISVLTAGGPLVHRPSRKPTGCVTAGFSNPSSIDSFPALDSDRSLGSSMSPTARSRGLRNVSGDTACSSTNSEDPRRRPRNPLSLTASAPSSTASTGRWI